MNILLDSSHNTNDLFIMHQKLKKYVEETKKILEESNKILIKSNEIINDHTHKNVNDIGKIPAGLKSNEIRHDNGMKKWIETLRN